MNRNDKKSEERIIPGTKGQLKTREKSENELMKDSSRWIFKIGVNPVEPIFGIAPDGKLVEAGTMAVWDPDLDEWDYKTRGFTLGYFAAAKPISKDEALLLTDSGKNDKTKC